MTEKKRLFIKATKETLVRVVDKYPFIYLEYGRLEVDDSSIKWIDSAANCIRLPVATISCLLLGPGTTVTHAAIKAASEVNCMILWVGEDSLHFYAVGIKPTNNSRNLRRQAELSSDPDLAVQVARAMFSRRFPNENLETKDLSSLMAMEGQRVRDTYVDKARQYGVGWRGRQLVPGKFELSDLTNKILTATNNLLYGIISSVVLSLGYSPHLGFIHSGSPLPFVYDIADLYKKDLCVDLAFYLTSYLSGEYNSEIVEKYFRERVINMDILNQSVSDINSLIGEESARRYRK